MWRTNHNNRKCRWPIILSLMNERLQAGCHLHITSCEAFKKQPHWTIDHFEALTITNQKYKASIFIKDTIFFPFEILWWNTRPSSSVLTQWTYRPQRINIIVIGVGLICVLLGVINCKPKLGTRDMK